jgi:hypothetical protein
VKKIILSVLVIIFAFTWTNRPQNFSPKISQVKQKSKAIKLPDLKIEPTSKVSPKVIESLTIPDYQCEGKTICSQMDSCKEAKFYLQNCNLKKIDRDKDGIPCEGRWCFHHKPNKKK